VCRFIDKLDGSLNRARRIFVGSTSDSGERYGDDEQGHCSLRARSQWQREGKPMAAAGFFTCLGHSAIVAVQRGTGGGDRPFAATAGSGLV
jgi:hypothetical protein